MNTKRVKISSLRVSDFMDDIHALSDESYQIIMQIRDLHFKFATDIKEDIKYNGLVFLRDNDLLSGIFCYKAHISLELGEGASLADPHQILEGKGKNRRHIKLRSLDDIALKQVRHFVKEILRRK